ncbi:hypothetical protein BKI52_22425 [marine bacterium AO1-C]|nr:hypothetical protein BKI52_22425 [marine bacterium AO1-C]
MIYKGGVSYDLIAKARNQIRQVFKRNKLGYKIQSVFLELAHNILLHSEEKNNMGNDEAVGTLVLDEREDYYLLITGNVVSNAAVEKLLVHCEHINSLDRKDLVNFKIKLSEREIDKNSRGGGLGLVQIVLLSGNTLQIATERINDQSTYLGFCAKIFKEKAKKEAHKEAEMV